MRFDPNNRHRGKAKKTRSKPQHMAKAIECQVVDQSHDGRGVAKFQGETVFIAGAINGERVKTTGLVKKKSWWETQVQAILEPSPHRVEPFCPHFQQCGGCSLQHVDLPKQLENKQQVLISQLSRLAGVTEQQWQGIQLLPAMASPGQHYRSRARFGVTEGQLSFRQKASKQGWPIDQCPVLSQGLNAWIPIINEHLLPVLKGWQLSELEISEDGQGQVSLVIHRETKAPLTKAKEIDAIQQSLALSQPLERISIFLRQREGSLVPLKSTKSVQTYGLEIPSKPPSRETQPLLPLTFRLAPGQFSQVNQVVNQAMVVQALNLLDLGPEDRVIDLFAGGGNFTLPIASQCQQVLALEGSDELVTLGQQNAHNNGLSNVEFRQADLFQLDDTVKAALGAYDVVLLDPPRAGAKELCTELAKLCSSRARLCRASQVGKVLYVSCNPATLARDAEALMAGGYQMTHVGVMDMFPHTDHVESMALFVHPRAKRQEK